MFLSFFFLFPPLYIYIYIQYSTVLALVQYSTVLVCVDAQKYTCAQKTCKKKGPVKKPVVICFCIYDCLTWDKDSNKRKHSEMMHWQH